MDLINELTTRLGIDANQARGGVGMLLNMAREKLGGGEFAEVADAVPESEAMMNEAPDPEAGGGGGLMGAMGGLMGSLGGGGGIGDLGKLMSGFDKLGIDASKIQQFLPIVLGFVREHGGPQVTALLEKVLPNQ